MYSDTKRCSGQVVLDARENNLDNNGVKEIASHRALKQGMNWIVTVLNEGIALKVSTDKFGLGFSFINPSDTELLHHITTDYIYNTLPTTFSSPVITGEKSPRLLLRMK